MYAIQGNFEHVGGAPQSTCYKEYVYIYMYYVSI